MRRHYIAACCGALMIIGCASQTPKTTGGLGNELPLTPGQYPGTLVYRSPTAQVGTGKYKSLLVDDAAIYRAADADFGKVEEADKVLRLTPLGLGINAAKTATGQASTLVGSVTVAGEITDTESSEALAGFVATESPIALDLTSGLGGLRAAELGIERGAEEFANALDRALNRTPPK